MTKPKLKKEPFFSLILTESSDEKGFKTDMSFLELEEHHYEAVMDKLVEAMNELRCNK